MKKSLRWAAIAVSAAVAVSLSACSGGNGGDSSSGKKASEIKVVIAEYSKDHTHKFWEQFKKTYEKKTGVDMKLQIINWDDLDQQSSTMIQTGNVPDVLNENAYSNYAAQDLLYDADQVLPKKTKDDIIPAFVKSGTYKGKFYGFPDLSSVRALFYNKDLFKKAGIADPPTTWDEFVSDAKKITALGGNTVGYAQPLGPEEAQAEFAIWAFNNGGGFKKDGKWVLNSKANVETLKFMKSLSTKDKVTEHNPGHVNRTDGAFPLFEQGKAGMIVGFGPLQTALDTDYKDINYGIVPMPTGNGGEPQAYGVTDYLMAFKKPGNKKALQEFYKLYYSPDQINKWIKAEGFLPVTKSGIKEFQSIKKDKTYLETLPNMHLTPTDDPEWNKIKLTMQQNIGLAVAPNGNPKQFLDKLQKQAEAGK